MLVVLLAFVFLIVVVVIDGGYELKFRSILPYELIVKRH